MSTSGVRGVGPAQWNDEQRDARRTPLHHIVLHLAPATRSVSIWTDDDRIDNYARVAYRRLVNGGFRPNEMSDRAELFTTQSPAMLRFNDQPIRPDDRSAPSLHANWSSGAYLVDQCVWRSLAADSDWYAVYGLAFAWRGRAALIAGDSGIGKTTLALALSARGAQLYGDEMILVHRKRHDVLAIPRMLTIRPGSIEQSGNERARSAFRMYAERLDADGETFALDTERLGPFPEAHRLALLAIATRGDGEPAFTPMSTLRATVRLAAFVSPRPVHVDELTALSTVLVGVASNALTLGEPSATAARLLRALDACS